MTTDRETTGAGQPKRRGRPTQLSREIVLKGALDLTRQQGLENFSIRELAALLGVSSMSTYRYFASRDDLVSAVVEHVYKMQLDVAQSPDADWRGDLYLLCRRTYDVFREYPGSAPYAMRHYLASPGRAQFIDRYYAFLRRAGLADEDLQKTGHLIVVFICGTVMREEYLKTADTEQAADVVDAETHPHLAKVLPYYIDPASEEFFESGIKIIFEGIKQQALSKKAGER